MKRTMVEKIEEAMRELEIARKWVYQLGEGDEEPARALHRRTMALDASPSSTKPLLIVSRAAPKERDYAEEHRRRKAKRPRTGNHATGREIVLKLFLASGNRPMRSSDVIDRWPGKVALVGKARQRVYQPLHELKKNGLLRHNTEDGYYALSEAGLRAAQAFNRAESTPQA